MKPRGKPSDVAGPEPRGALVLAAAVAVAVGFTPLVHYNALVPVLDLSPPHTSEDPGLARRLYDEVVDAGRRIGLGTVWRMYSPARKSSIWVRWFVVEPGEPPEVLPLPDMSPHYKSRRGFAARWLWDSRRPILSVQHQLTPEVRVHYARYLCRTRPELDGRPRASVRAMQFHRVTPPPSQRGSFSPFDGPVDEIRHLGTYPCNEEAP